MRVIDETSGKIAEYLLQIKAIKLQPDTPFTWASGWKSPIYCDNRISLSYPDVRTFIRQALVSSIEDHFGKPELIAGVATAAIAQGALVADAMKLPFVYVRAAAKDHGRENLIEGETRPGQSVVVIEDLISTGASSLKAVRVLREAGCRVLGMISVFTYGLEVAKNNFRQEGCEVTSLCDYDCLLEKALEAKSITTDELETLRKWRQAPESWGR